LIQNKLEQLQKELNRRLRISNAKAGLGGSDDEDEEEQTSIKISKKINNII
jgi:hypothetical protein